MDPPRGGKVLSLARSCLVGVWGRHRGGWVSASGLSTRNGVTDLGCDLELVRKAKRRYYLGKGGAGIYTSSTGKKSTFAYSIAGESRVGVFGRTQNVRRVRVD